MERAVRANATGSAARATRDIDAINERLVTENARRQKLAARRAARKTPRRVTMIGVARCAIAGRSSPRFPRGASRSRERVGAEVRQEWLVQVLRTRWDRTFVTRASTTRARRPLKTSSRGRSTW